MFRRIYWKYILGASPTVAPISCVTSSTLLHPGAQAVLPGSWNSSPWIWGPEVITSGRSKIWSYIKPKNRFLVDENSKVKLLTLPVGFESNKYSHWWNFRKCSPPKNRTLGHQKLGENLITFLIAYGSKWEFSKLEFSKIISPQKNFVAISESYILIANRQKSRASENQKNAPRAILRILASVTAILLIEGILFSRQKKVSQLPFECSNVPFRI